jgi:hypothetical protein
MRKAIQTEQEKVIDRITAAMETGNHAQARTLLTEFREHYPEMAENVRADIIAGYGIAI